MVAVIFAPDSGDQFKEFQREAAKAAAHWGAEIHLFPAGKSAHVRRQFVLDVLAAPRVAKLGRVAFLCHGYRTGIQAGFDLATAKDLAQALRNDAPSCIVSLYCCSTGKGPQTNGEGSFADILRDALAHYGQRGTWMLTHTTAGHLSRNPDVRMYRIEPNIGGGVDVCVRTKESRDLYRRFRGLLHTPTGRWDISAMSPEEIEAAAARCDPWVDPQRKPA